MDLLNVKYEISHVNKSYTHREGCLPCAFWVPDYRILPKDAILDHLVSPHFDPTRTVLFEEEDHISDLPRQPSKPWKKIDARIEMISYRPDEIVRETTSSESGFLFLSEIFYPGWKAYVDEKRRNILRGNYIFRTLEVPAGSHRVKFVFEPASVKLGMSVTAFSLVIILCMLWLHFRRRIPPWHV